MEWLGRNAEFLTPDSISKCLLAFKELYIVDSVSVKNAYIHAKHTSDAVVTIAHLIDTTAGLNRDEEAMSRLAILLSILEALLINDMNLEKSIHVKVVKLLLQFIYVPEAYVKAQGLDDIEEEQKRLIMLLPIYLKYAFRCLTSALRNQQGLAQFMGEPTGIPQVLEFLDVVKEEEILANASKIIRIALREDKVRLIL